MEAGSQLCQQSDADVYTPSAPALHVCFPPHNSTVETESSSLQKRLIQKVPLLSSVPV